MSRYVLDHPDMKLVALVLLLSLAPLAQAELSTADLSRATRVSPRPALAARSFSLMVQRLNLQLTALGVKTRPCSLFSGAELRELLQLLLATRDPALQSLYLDRGDKRQLSRPDHAFELGSPGLEAHLRAEPGLAQMATAARCHDAVMLFVHHLDEAARELVRLATHLPLLPDEQRLGREPSPAARAIHADYVQASSCASGHIIGDGATNFTPGCLGSDECPVWPEQFSAPFGLHATIPPIHNATSMFYYKVLKDDDPANKKQLVDYQSYCFPFVNLLHYKQPCKLYFQKEGIYLHQPGHVNCCQFNSGNVSAVPLQFLHQFKLKERNVMAEDFYGNKVSCDHWEGPLNFQYWTVGHNDTRYKNWGHDIVFQDGPTGVTWQWGNFDVAPQDDSIFELPGTPEECAKKCPTF